MEESPEAAAGVEWIPVTERMPPMGVWVLVFDPTVDDKLESRIDAAQCTQWNFDTIWSLDAEYGRYHVTHWRPLPAAPKVDAESLRLLHHRT